MKKRERKQGYEANNIQSHKITIFRIYMYFNTIKTNP